MDLNQILRDEQITMMRLSGTTNVGDRSTQNRELSRLAGKLSLFIYPHRPYVRRKAKTGVRTDTGASLRLSLAGWENEGGAR